MDGIQVTTVPETSGTDNIHVSSAELSQSGWSPCSEAGVTQKHVTSSSYDTGGSLKLRLDRDSIVRKNTGPFPLRNAGAKILNRMIAN